MTEAALLEAPRIATGTKAASVPVTLSKASIDALADAITSRRDRISVTAPDAAQLLGLSRDSFDEYVAPRIRCIRVGRRKLYRLTELERWAEANESRAFE